MLTLIKNIFMLSAISLLIPACSTLNKDECKAANWKTIGYEDGTKGYPASRIGQHRSACAQHSIQPDLNAYTEGRKKGLNYYCIPSTGYKKGLYGYSYNGLCAGYNEHAFLDAYKHGLSIYREEKKLNHLKASYEEEQRYIESLEIKLHDKEDILVSGRLSKVKALILLNKTKEISEDLGRSKSNLELLSEDIYQQSQQIKRLKYLSSY